jgi:hypothetical protein
MSKRSGLRKLDPNTQNNSQLGASQIGDFVPEDSILVDTDNEDLNCPRLGT